ncbi:hypothetical protein CAL14_18380 [Bordetella genomosp. 9]|uniref:hypothetical protein n=1 Tax=Bordetella genomosp. 9 TaxID=1416803 RepID=UPI000A28D2D8|nr:hypothetical protein [Bordetella genomosp. 9]ARP92003.1 hypothetical protein CAL14_18380 [Bordetella genomosp. 9]
MTVFRIAAGILALSALAGCSALQSTQHIADFADAQGGSGRDAVKQFKEQAQDVDRAKGQVVGLPWIAGRAQPLARDVSLPPALRANVNTTLLFAGGAVDLTTLADRIQAATGILTQVAPDALLPRDYFLPRLGGENPINASVAAPATADVLVPALVPIPESDRVSGPTLPAALRRPRFRPPWGTAKVPPRPQAGAAPPPVKPVSSPASLGISSYGNHGYNRPFVNRIGRAGTAHLGT